MINAETIAKMKDGVVILNFARDLLVDDEVMAAALASGKVRRYITDFPNDRTAKMPGCIAIPHLGASTEESEDNCAKMAVSQVMNYLENGNIVNSVNFPNCDMGVCTSQGRITILHKNIPNSWPVHHRHCRGECQHCRPDEQEPGGIRLHHAGCGPQAL